MVAAQRGHLLRYMDSRTGSEIGAKDALKRPSCNLGRLERAAPDVSRRHHWIVSFPLTQVMR